MVSLGNRYTVLGAGVGILADRVLGDPPNRFDPIALYGQAVGRATDQDVEAGRAKRKAVAVAAAATAVGAASGWGLKKLTGPFGAACIGAWSVIRGKSRSTRALEVAAALGAGDIGAARAAMPTMVKHELDETPDELLASLAIDAIAEDSIDGVVGPALWAAAAGATGSLAYRAINMLDAAVGSHSERHERAGIAGDAVDLVANFVPAVVAAGMVALVRPAAAGEIWQGVREDRRGYRSRSVGIVSAAFGAALGRRPGPDGQRPPAAAADVVAAVNLSRDLSLAMAAWCIALGGLGAVAAFRKASTGGD